EDPARSFFPSPGPILALSEPSGPGVRVDSGVVAGGVVPVEYDPLLAKISAWAPDRTVAVRRLRAALEETVVLGPTTNLPFLLDVLGHPAFLAGDTHTGFLAEHLPEWRPGGPDEGHVLEVDGRAVRTVVARSRDRVLVALAGRVYIFETGEEARQAAAGMGTGTVVAPMPGKVLAVLVAPGERVAIGQPLVVL